MGRGKVMKETLLPHVRTWWGGMEKRESRLGKSRHPKKCLFVPPGVMGPVAHHATDNCGYTFLTHIGISATQKGLEMLKNQPCRN